MPDFIASFSTKLIFGPFLAAADGRTPVTTIAAPTAMKYYRLNGADNGTIDMTAGGRTWTHIGGGFYEAYLPDDLTDTGTWTFLVTDASALPVRLDIDSIGDEYAAFKTTDTKPRVTVFTGGITAASFAAGAITSSAIATDAIDADALAGDAALEIAGAVLQAFLPYMFARVSTITAGSTSSVTLDSGASSTDEYYRGTVFVLSGTGAGQVARIVNYTGSTKVLGVVPSFATAPTAGSVVGIVPDSPSLLTVPTRAQIWDEVLSTHTTAGTVGNYLRKLLAAAATLSSDFHADSALGQMLNKASGTWGYSQATDSLEALRDRGDAAWTSSTLDAAERNRIADAVIRRNFATARASAEAGLDAVTARSLLGAGSRLVNKVAISGTVLTVYAEDDSTVFTTCVLVGSGSAQPIVSIDPA